MSDQFQQPEILFDDDVFYRIKSILKDSDPTQGVFIVTPYIKLDTRMKDAFDDAFEKNVRVTMLIRADADHPLEDVNWLLRKRVILRKVDKLHAKIYISAMGGLVASMNLHSFSGQESKEVGVFFKDELSIKRLQDRVNKWIGNSLEVDPIGALSKTQASEKPQISIPNAVQKAPIAQSSGHCIRCGAPKTFNPKYPLCDTCYPKWAKYKDENYEEKFCHRCGTKHSSSVKYPLCKPCWSATNK